MRIAGLVVGRVVGRASIGHRCHAFQFNGDGRGQPVDFNGGAARLGCRIGEILGVNAIECREIAVHVNQENRDVDQCIPAAPVGLEDGIHVGKNTVDLSLKIEFLEIPIVVQSQSRNPAIMGVASRDAGPNTAQKEQVTRFSSKGVGPNGLGRALGVVCHAAKIAQPASVLFCFVRMQPGFDE